MKKATPIAAMANNKSTQCIAISLSNRHSVATHWFVCMPAPNRKTTHNVDLIQTYPLAPNVDTLTTRTDNNDNDQAS
ncbi:hypothetical protein XFEB_00021 [Xylella fastidiosa EB92.1]|nr:hypothetical protein XFEB_00021 [Xylella fastidiosa EB92.1]